MQKHTATSKATLSVQTTNQNRNNTHIGEIRKNVGVFVCVIMCMVTCCVVEQYASTFASISRIRYHILTIHHRQIERKIKLNIYTHDYIKCVSSCCTYLCVCEPLGALLAPILEPSLEPENIYSTPRN